MQIGLATFLGWVGGVGWGGGWVGGWVGGCVCVCVCVCVGGGGGGEYTICLGRTSRSSTNIFHMYMM